MAKVCRESGSGPQGPRGGGEGGSAFAGRLPAVIRCEGFASWGKAVGEGRAPGALGAAVEPGWPPPWGRSSCPRSEGLLAYFVGPVSTVASRWPSGLTGESPN